MKPGSPSIDMYDNFNKHLNINRKQKFVLSSNKTMEKSEKKLVKYHNAKVSGHNSWSEWSKT